MTASVKALGEHVILVAKAESAGTETKSPMGIITGVRETGEVPETCEVYSIGDKVPEGYLKVGDKVPLTNGIMKHVVNPVVLATGADPKKLPEKYVSTHYSQITGVYSGV